MPKAKHSRGGPEVFSAASWRSVREAASAPNKARALLEEAGIVDAEGNLTSSYARSPAPSGKEKNKK